MAKAKRKIDRKRDSVFVLRISHRHGVDIGVSWTRSGVDHLLYEYVAEFWEENWIEEEMPEDKQEAIKRYFCMEEGFPDEHYEIYKTKVFDLAQHRRRKAHAAG